MKPRHITKQDFLNYLVCPTLGWFTYRDSSASSPSIGDLLRMSEGKRVGEAARRQFKYGVLVSEPSTEQAAQKTLALLNDPTVSVIFEATFQAGCFIAKADILIRDKLGWQLFEVKSGLNDKQDYLHDLAYTAFVMTRAGKPPTQASLQLMSRDYRLGQAESKMFAKPLDRTVEVQDLISEYETLAPSIESSLRSESSPKPHLIGACKGCPYFEQDCLGQGIDHHILHLPRKPKGLLEELSARKVSRIADIPDDYRLNKSHEIIRSAVRQGKPQYDSSALKKRLQGIKWPAAYLDFETITTAIPRYHSLAPYEQMVTQFSIHICDQPGSIVSHHDFLADAHRDSREDLIQHLLELVENSRSIIVYSSFEKQILNQLVQHPPRHGKRLQGCINKLFDLLTVLKPNTYYHPDLKGSYSIKAVLPVLVPGYSYDHLAINNGTDAVAMFVKIIDGQCTPEESATIRQNLLEYCKLDTLAMVKLHEQLEIMVTAGT